MLPLISALFCCFRHQVWRMKGGNSKLLAQVLKDKIKWARQEEARAFTLFLPESSVKAWELPWTLTVAVLSWGLGKGKGKAEKTGDQDKNTKSSKLKALPKQSFLERQASQGLSIFLLHKNLLRVSTETKQETGSREMVLQLKSPCYSCRGSQFKSQHCNVTLNPYNFSSRNVMPSSGLQGQPNT